jgi:hypothetical protein
VGDLFPADLEKTQKKLLAAWCSTSYLQNGVSLVRQPTQIPAGSPGEFAGKTRREFE